MIKTIFIVYDGGYWQKRSDILQGPALFSRAKNKIFFFSQKKLFDRQKDQRKRSNRQGEEIKLTRERHKRDKGKRSDRQTRERDQTNRQEKEIRQTDKRKRSDR